MRLNQPGMNSSDSPCLQGSGEDSPLLRSRPEGGRYKSPVEIGDVTGDSFVSLYLILY
jgi:hypothetical protein